MSPRASPPRPSLCQREGCEHPAVKQGPAGPPRRYCSNQCRQAAYRQRRADGHTGAKPKAKPVAELAAEQRLADAKRLLQRSESLAKLMSNKRHPAYGPLNRLWDAVSGAQPPG
jgi:hypothetical protein